MTFIKIINTKISPFINNGIFRYSHHHSLTKFSDSHITTSYIQGKNDIIINLLGDRKSVDTASWEIKSFAQEKFLHTANIVYHDQMLKDLLYNNYLKFIVNRCYNMSCQNLLYLNNDITNTNTNTNRIWIPYNLYVLPDATNRFNNSEFIRNCEKTNIIVYPLAASEENKRRDINILLDN